MVPLSKKLAYYFERATGRGTIYSEVYNSASQFEGKLDYTESRWHKATPVSGQKDRYIVTSNYYGHDETAGLEGRIAGIEDDASTVDARHGIWSRDGVTKIFSGEAILHTNDDLEATHPFAAKELQPLKP